jgi:hypothetical protein
MIWLDGVLAVPAVGIRILPKLSEWEKFETFVYHFLDNLQTKRKLDCEIKVEKPWALIISVKSVGYSFRINSENLIADFTYQIGSEEQAGKFPAQRIPATRAYSDLLNEELEYIKEILSVAKNVREVKFRRIGVVAKLILDKESIPPGISKWISHLGKPWDGLLAAETLLTAKLHEEGGYSDKCLHFLKFSEETPETGFQFVLDWQRYFKEPITLDERDTFEKVKICRDEALSYFKRLGEGGLNYG